MTSLCVTTGLDAVAALATKNAAESEASPPGPERTRTLSLSDFKEFHGLLWKQSPNILRLYTHQLRYISLWQGKLMWSLPDKNGSPQEYKGCVDFARNPSIAEPMEGSSTRLAVRPVNGVWQSAKFTGSDSGRWLCFDAAGCSHTREEWLEKINTHICYGRQQLTGSSTASLLAVAAGARLLALAHKAQEKTALHAEASAETQEAEAPSSSHEVSASPAKTPEPETPDRPPKAASPATPDNGASASPGGGDASQECTDKAASPATPDNGASASPGGGDASQECTDKDVARAYLGGMLSAIGQAVSRRRPSSGRPSQESSPLVERSQQMEEASEAHGSAIHDLKERMRREAA